MYKPGTSDKYYIKWVYFVVLCAWYLNMPLDNEISRNPLLLMLALRDLTTWILHLGTNYFCSQVFVHKFLIDPNVKMYWLFAPQSSALQPKTHTKKGPSCMVTLWQIANPTQSKPGWRLQSEQIVEFWISICDEPTGVLTRVHRHPHVPALRTMEVHWGDSESHGAKG